MASSKHKEADGEAPSGVESRFAKFHLDERPQRKAGQNAYFDDIKEQIARSQQSDNRDSAEDTNLQSEELEADKINSSSPVSVDYSTEDGDRDDRTQQTEIRVRPLVLHQQGRKRSTDKDKATVSSLTPLPSGVTQPSFEDFKRLWGPFLKSKQMELCEVLFKHTIAMGRTEFITKTDELCKEVGVSSRHLLYLLRQLERLGFVTRHDEKTETNKTLGKSITFQPFPPR
ncbi:MAG: hypothetical protein WBV94_06045 [Blastocatellia bacterium]